MTTTAFHTERVTTRRAAAYGVAIAAPLMLILAKSWAPWLAMHPYVLLLMPTTTAAWIGGKWPGVASALVSTTIVELGLLGRGTHTPGSGSEVFLLLGYLGESAVIITVLEALHRSRRRLAASNVALQGARLELEAQAEQLRQAHAQLQRSWSVELAEEQSARQGVEHALRGTEEQLRHAQKMEAVGRLAGGIAHDFNNLLSIILGYSAMVSSSLPAEDPLRADVDEIAKAGERAAELTRQLLAFSRRQVFSERIVDLNALVGGMHRMIRRLLGEDIEVVFQPDAVHHSVLCDPGQIEQVLMNLIVNARDAMPRGGTLTIETRDVELDESFAASHAGVQPGAHVMLAITDTGVGIPAEIQARIFEPFFTTKDVGRGTGLGLSTVYGIVKQSGGTIWVSSEVGRGTVFTVYLPRTQVEPLTPESPPAARRACGGTVLLVEDEDQLRVLTRSLLRRAGYTVLDARDGAEALQACARHASKIDLLLTDVVMPMMCGRELAERARLVRPDMKALFMSGYTDEVIGLHGGLESQVAFLEKPINANQLLTKVSEMIGA
ncbi:MAG: response regulator [Deltaproteobacteria bacterium]|nr:response regulator [Deltaproteobacteria bacterium]